MTGKPGVLQSVGLQRVRHNLAPEQQTTTVNAHRFLVWARKIKKLLTTSPELILNSLVFFFFLRGWLGKRYNIMISNEV